MNMQFICTTYYRTVRNDEVIHFTTIWMELGDIMLNEIIQKKGKNKMISHICSLKSNLMRNELIKEGKSDPSWPQRIVRRKKIEWKEREVRQVRNNRV